MKKTISTLLLGFIALWAGELEQADKAFDKQEYKKATKLYKKACDANKAKACDRLGFMYFNANGVKVDENLSLKYYQKACKLNEDNGCYRVGLAYEKAGALKKAESFYSKACKMGKARACEKLGDLYRYSLDGSRKQIIKTYKKACEGGSVHSCYQLAFMYEQKDHKDLEKAIKWHKKACDKEDIESCHRLVDIYVKNIAYMDFDEKTVQEYTQKCEQKDGVYRYQLAVLYMIGKGVKQDYSKAKSILKTACDDGDKACCMELIMLEDRGY